MPTSATGNNSSGQDPAREAGFSLVELLAVLAILSLMMGAVVLNWPQGRTEADRRTEVMAQQVSRFLDDGAVAGEMRALGADEEALALFRHNGTGWAEVARLDWPDRSRIVLRQDGEEADLSDEAEPSFLFEPYGAVPDFELIVQARDTDYVLSPDDQGRLDRTVGR